MVGTFASDVDLVREVPDGTAYTQQSHAVGSIVRISDKFQFWEDIARTFTSKMDTDGSNAADAIDINTSGNRFRIRYDAGDMKLTDDNQSEVSLCTLAAGSGGTDEKIKITSNDTTGGYLNSKLTAGD